VKTSDIKGLLSGAVILNWRLLLDKVDSNNRQLTLDFEEKVNRWWNGLKAYKNVKAMFDKMETSLLHQMERLEIAHSCEAALEELKAHSVSILGGEYLFCDFEVHEHEEQYAYTYTSLKSVILAVAPISLQSTKVEVNIGKVPPAQVEDSWPTYVNGVEINVRKRNWPNPAYPTQVAAEAAA
jgi:hypothetical protein